MPRTHARRLLSVSALVLGGLASCAAPHTTSASLSATDWLEPSADLQRQIDQKAIEVSTCQDRYTWVGLSDWFQSVGEPAYGKLLEMVEFGDPRQRSTALCVIAAMQDRRLLQPMRDAMPASALESESTRREYARALAKLGDFSELPVLIEAMRDSNPEQFGLAHRALEEVTNTDIKVSATSTPEERERIVQAWMTWWTDHQADFLLR